MLYKPWRGDDLTEVRTVVGRVASPRVHVVDPDFVPFHNLDVMEDAVTVITSPTSFLAEFAAMGMRPIMLALPDTAYYHGTIRPPRSSACTSSRFRTGTRRSGSELAPRPPAEAPPRAT